LPITDTSFVRHSDARDDTKQPRKGTKIMSLTAVFHNIVAASKDSHLSAAEADQILSREDGMFSDPESLGTFVDEREHHSLKALAERIDSGALTASPDAYEALKSVVEAGPDSRATYALTGGQLGIHGALSTGVGAGVTAGAGEYGLVSSYSGAANAARYASMVFGVYGLGAAAVAYAAGAVHGLLDD